MTTREELDRYFRQLERTATEGELMQEIADTLCHFDFKHVKDTVAMKYLSKYKIFVVCRNLDVMQVKYFTAYNDEDYIRKYNSKFDDWEFQQAIRFGHAFTSGNFHDFRIKPMKMEEYNRYLGEINHQITIDEFLGGME